MTIVMGVLNVTPDSFSDGGRYDNAEAAVAHGRLLASQGAGIVDVGGESTRPGAARVPEAEEMARVIPVIAALAAHGITCSVDTMRASVARAAVAAGPGSSTTSPAGSPSPACWARSRTSASTTSPCTGAATLRSCSSTPTTPTSSPTWPRNLQPAATPPGRGHRGRTHHPRPGDRVRQDLRTELAAAARPGRPPGHGTPAAGRGQPQTFPG